MDCIYINLNSATERRLKFESNFEARKTPNWTLSRFAAIDTDTVKNNNVAGECSPAEKGCFLSHKVIIESNLAHDKSIFILEDDASFGVRTCNLIDGILAQNRNLDWDILFTDVCIPHLTTMMDLLKFRRELTAKKIEVAFMKLSKTNFNGSTAYIVNAKSKQKLFDQLNYATELNIPYDLYLRSLIHISALKGYSLFPFVTSLSDFSDISQVKLPGANRDELTWNMFRKMIWLERNLASCTSALESIKDGLSEQNLAAHADMVSSPDKELKAFGILFSSMTAQRAQQRGL
jgi:GR25 family glycosyltransferase involved in LPS biosynthesis